MSMVNVKVERKNVFKPKAGDVFLWEGSAYYAVVDRMGCTERLLRDDEFIAIRLDDGLFCKFGPIISGCTKLNLNIVATEAE